MKTLKTCMLRATTCIATLGLAVANLPARAHGGADLSSGFMLAAAHPWTGVDHLLAAVAAGMLAVHLGGRAGRAVAAAYLGGLVAGVALGVAGWATTSPLEMLLAASVVALGALLLMPAARARGLAVFIAGGFAVVHGHAHQWEGGMNVLSTAMGGLWVSTAALVLVGTLAGQGLFRTGLHKAHVALPLAGFGSLLMLRTLWT